MSIARLNLDGTGAPWTQVFELAGMLPQGSWMLVGGLMVQAHAMLAGAIPRVTRDIDVLIDVMADLTNIHRVVSALEEKGFVKQEPVMRGSCFHRMISGSAVVDVLVADHLPTGRRGASRVNRWPMMEVPGGAQAIERKMEIRLESDGGARDILIPDLLGALILKCAARASDNRAQYRHVQDAALLLSLMTDPVVGLARLHGSDRKRLRSMARVLADPHEPAWLQLDADSRQAGMFALQVLTS